jgi:hypothetical protein
VLPLELPRSELFLLDDTPLEEPRSEEPLLMSLLFDPLSMPFEPTLPLVRLLGSFNEFSDCPIFCPKLAEDPLLLLWSTLRLMSPAFVELSR